MGGYARYNLFVAGLLLRAAGVTPALPTRRPPLLRTLLGGALILLACLLAYAPVLHGKFLWDDLYLVGGNPFFRSPRFFLEVFRHYLFLDSFSVYYRPVQNLSYILDYAIWNQDTFGYHLSNILFHAASAFLLFLVVRRCLRAMPLENTSPNFVDAASFAVALLWAVHPIHNAAVAYVSGRADSIAMMFALAGWLLFLNGKRNIAALALAPVCVLAALCAKEIALIWIALFAVYLFALSPRLGSVRIAFQFAHLSLARDQPDHLASKQFPRPGPSRAPRRAGAQPIWPMTERAQALAGMIAPESPARARITTVCAKVTNCPSGKFSAAPASPGWRSRGRPSRARGRRRDRRSVR